MAHFDSLHRAITTGMISSSEMLESLSDTTDHVYTKTEVRIIPAKLARIADFVRCNGCGSTERAGTRCSFCRGLVDNGLAKQ